MKWLAATSALLIAVIVAAADASASHGASSGDRPASPTGQVSGRWTIVIRNRSGQVVRRAHFENALVGKNVLPELLAGTATAGGWKIEALEGGVLTQGKGKGKSTTLDAAAAASPSTGPQGGVLLAGTMKIRSGGTLTSVASALTLCPPTVAPRACDGAAGRLTPYTRKDGLAIPVATGDTASIAVILSVKFANNVADGIAQGDVEYILLGTLTPSWWSILGAPLGNSIDDFASGTPSQGVSVTAVGGVLSMTATHIAAAATPTGVTYVLLGHFCVGATRSAFSPSACAASVDLGSSDFFQEQISDTDTVAAGQQVVVTIRIAFN
jgi:hypothetical protein